MYDRSPLPFAREDEEGMPRNHATLSISETVKLPALNDWRNWPLNDPTCFPLFYAHRFEKLLCDCGHPNCRRCDVTREVFHISEFTANGREVMDGKVNMLQLQSHLGGSNKLDRERPCSGTTQCPSFRLFFLCNDDCHDILSSSYLHLFMAHSQTPPRFVLRKRMDETVPPIQAAHEEQTDCPGTAGTALAGSIASSSSGRAQSKMLHILVQLSLSMRPMDILAHSEYYSAEWVASMHDWTGNNMLWGSHTLLYLRYNCGNRECTILVANNSSAFHHMRQFCASPDVVLGSDDPFVFVVAYMEQLLIRSQNVEHVLQTWLFEWMETFGATSAGTDNTELFKHINYTSALLPRRVMFMKTIARTIERIKGEHKCFLNSLGTAAPLGVATVVEERLDAQLQLASELRMSFSSLSTSLQRLSDMFLGYAQFRNGIATNTIAADNQKQAAATEALARDSRRDSEIMKRDSATMKTITVVTLVYLPATFVSTLLSMGMFDFGVGSGGDGRIHIARQGWIFLAISLPLTAITLGIAYLWKQSKEKQWKREDNEAETSVA